MATRTPRKITVNTADMAGAAVKPAAEHPAVAAIRQSTAGKVKVACSDIDGILRGKYLHRDKFLGAAEPYPDGGFGFCDVVFGWDSHCAGAGLVPSASRRSSKCTACSIATA